MSTLSPTAGPDVGRKRRWQSCSQKRLIEARAKAEATVAELSEHLEGGVGRDEAIVMGCLINAWRLGGSWVQGFEFRAACGWRGMRDADVGKQLAEVMVRLRRFLGSTKFGAAGGDGGAWIEAGPNGWRLRTGKRSIAMRSEEYGKEE